MVMLLLGSRLQSLASLLVARLKRRDFFSFVSQLVLRYALFFVYRSSEN